MGNYEFVFDKSSRKYICPRCLEKRLVLFRDAETNELQPVIYGICDRSESCGFKKYPVSKRSYNYNLSRSQYVKSFHVQKPQRERVFIPSEVLEATLGGYDDCSFFNFFLNKNIPSYLLERVIEMYRLGTIQSGYLSGALTIPFITIDDKICFVQVKTFNKYNSTTKTSALHSILKGSPNSEWIKDFEKNETKIICFFGAHLLRKYPKNPIILVEAPKTAIYGTLYYGLPENDTDFLWIAVYNKTALSLDRFKDLKGRTIVIFPDLSKDKSTYNEWSNKAKEFAEKIDGTVVSINNFLEEYAPDELKQKGGDLADYLTQFDWKEFQEFLDNGSDVKSVKNDAENKSFFNDEPEAVEESEEDNLLDLLEGQRSYTIEELETIFMDVIGINRADANYCFNYLYNDNAIKKTSYNEYYYLATSTPF